MECLPTIYERHLKCLDSFSRFLSAIHSSPDRTAQVSLEEVLEELDKYKVWAGNTGASNSGAYWELSLDFRLQEASFLKSQVRADYL